MRRLLKFVLFALFAIALFVSGWISGRTGIGRVVDAASLTDGERQFTERMRNVTMVGTFSVWGREERVPRTDRYGSPASRRWAKTCGGSTRRWIAAV